jgi:flavodoxin I
METIIIYSTLTGNTEITAEWIRDRLMQAGHRVTMENAGNIYPEILQDYNLIILGSPTYWSGEVTDDFVPFLDKLAEEDLTGKKAAVFGLGDSVSYPDEYAHAVEIIEDALARAGAELSLESLKIDGDPEASRDQILAWAEDLSQTFGAAIK